MLSRLLLTSCCLAFFWSLQAQYPCIPGQINLASENNTTFCDDGSSYALRFKAEPAGIPSAFVVVDNQNVIQHIGFQSTIDFAGLGADLKVFAFTAIGSIIAEVGDILGEVKLASGCYALSDNFIAIDGGGTNEGGTLSGGPFAFCVGDGVPDMLQEGDITLAGNSGSNSAWVVTDEDGLILGLPPMPTDVNFDGAGAGTCLVWHLSYEDGLVGLEGGLNANDLQGCYSLSNPISVVRSQPEGGTLTGGPFAFCVGDGVPDMLQEGDITLAGNSGSNSAWVVTDEDGLILGLPPMPTDVNFDGAGAGTCLVWHLSYEDGLVGLEGGLNANDLEGCYSLSNPISVVRSQSEGGTLTGGPFAFCVGDGVPDMLQEGDITLAGNSGSNSAWVVTNEDGLILGLPPMPTDVNFDGAGAGTCLVWHLSYEDGLVGLEGGLNANDLEGCYSLSNPISVVRSQSEGGTLTGGPFAFCVGDGVPDMLQEGDITLAGNSGSNSAWVVTNEDGLILGLPPMPTDVNFDGAGAGTCLVWHLSYEDGLVGLEGGLNANDLEGCYSLSNPISVVRTAVNGGLVRTEDGETEVTVTVGDGMEDILFFSDTLVMGENFTYLVTDTANNILALPDSNMVDFEGAGIGICRVWGLAYTGNIIASSADNAGIVALSDGCYSLSENFVTINRVGNEAFQPNLPQTEERSIAPESIQLTLYPNPTINVLQLNIDGIRDHNKQFEIQILDLHGKLMDRRMISGEETDYQLEVSDLPAGAYFIRVHNGQSLIIKRFIKS